MTLLSSYPDGNCPDCGEPIPEDAEDGDQCANCGHVFHTENTNCLDGIKCPKCGAIEPFDITARTNLVMFDNGSDHDESHEDLEWDNDSPCLCLACRFAGKVLDFRAKAPQPDDPSTEEAATTRHGIKNADEWKDDTAKKLVQMAQDIEETRLITPAEHDRWRHGIYEIAKLIGMEYPEDLLTPEAVAARAQVVFLVFGPKPTNK